MSSPVSLRLALPVAALGLILSACATPIPPRSPGWAISSNRLRSPMPAPAPSA